MARKGRRGAGRRGGADVEEETAAAAHRVLARCATAAVVEETAVAAVHQGAQDRSPAGRGVAAGSATPGGDCGGMRVAAARRRLAGQSCTRPPFSSSSSSTKGRPWEVWGKACSLVCLGLLSDQAASFQPVVQATPPHRQSCREAAVLRNQHAAAPSGGDCDAPLLQGSFAGHPARQGRRTSYVWGLGWSAVTPESSRTALAATPAAGSGEWGSGGGGGVAGGGAGAGGTPTGGGRRGRGGRGSSESSAGAREAHAYAQAAAPPVAEERDTDRFLDLDRPEDKPHVSTVEDFPRIVEALSCYNRVHGHLRMIPAFRVPPNAPWPESLWGMELGRMVHRLRNEQAIYDAQFPERVQLLLTMGFEWEHTAVPDEWELIILGIGVFFGIHGHSRVPMRFIVPAEEPWPMEIWGHKLGSRIAQMRMTGRWLGQDEKTTEERRTILEQYGFEWRLRVKDDEYDADGNPEEFSILCEGLEVYRQLGGSVPNMPPTWVVPNADPWPIRTRGFPLGAQVRIIRSRQKYAKDSQEKTDILLALDVPINPNITNEKIGGRWGGPTETRFNKLCKALETFVVLYGHAQVPNTFEVPRDTSWPEETWDVKLGRSLVNIVSKGTFIKGYPDRQARLEALGFDTDPGGIRGFKELVKSGMSEADALAESQASLDFASEPSGLAATGGAEGTAEMDSQMLLGNVVDSLRTEGAGGGSGGGAGLSPSPPQFDGEEVEEGELLGQQPPPPRAIAQPNWMDTTESKPGDDDDDAEEKKTVVPSFMKTEFTDEDRRLATDQTDLRYWPNETQAHVVRRMIPQLGYLARGYDEPATLDGPIGTNMVTLPGVLTPLQWDPKRKKEPEEYGYMERDEDDFLGEEEEDEIESDGMVDRQKGRRLIPGCSTAGSSLEWCTDEDREKILEVGFEWDEFGDGFRWDDVVAGLTLYKTLYGELPDDDFQVPVDYEWPIELSGMQLGTICKQMRIGDIWAKHDPKRKKALKQLDFDWGDDELYLYFQWPEVLISFYSVIKLKGHLDVSPQYVIPHEDPWPLPLHGTPVGLYLNIIRAQKDLLMERYPERFEILRSMGIMWNEPLLVDWREEEEHLVYPWREWGVVKRGPEDDDESDITVLVDPEFGLDGSSSLM